VSNYALIGDIHSNYRRLSETLSYCRDHQLIPIFLGDLFDSRCEESETVKVYHLIQEAEEDLNAIVLQSNHQNKLIRYLKGNKVILNHGLEKTVEEFNNSSVDLNVLLEWLETRPYGFVFRDKNGEEYRCAHAYFSSRIEVPEYENCYEVHASSLNNKIKNIMIYGPVNTDGRISWWDSPRRHNYRMIAGHYHVVVDREHCLILDGECGDEGEHVFLALYDVNKRILKKFF
jgi:hypothetical protein